MFLKVITWTAGFLNWTCGIFQKTKSLKVKKYKTNHHHLPSRCYVYPYLPSPIMMVPICIVVDAKYSHFIFQHQTSSIQIVQSTTYGSSTFHERHAAALFLQCFIEKIIRKSKKFVASLVLSFSLLENVWQLNQLITREKCISCVHATELIDAGNTIVHLEW